MTPQYLTRKIYLIEPDTTEHDLTPDVITDDITASWGIPGSGPLDRVASVGIMSFTLNNATMQYSPENYYAVAWWKKGAVIELRLTYDGNTRKRFRGKVDAITIQVGTFRDRRVQVKVADWMDITAKHNLAGMDIAYDQTADQVVTAIIANMPTAPLSTNYGVGRAVFPAAFDTLTDNTKALSELAKVAVSEMGYVYLRHDPPNGETLVFENIFDRNSLTEITTPAYLLQEDGSKIILESGDGFLMLDNTPFYMYNSMADAAATYGDNVINQVKATAYPKKVDLIADGVKTLYKLSSPMMVGSRQTITIRGTYSDPTGAGRHCTADPDIMRTPVDPLVTIASSTNATPIEITTMASHGLAGGDHVVVSGHGTNTAANGNWTITYVSTTKFTLNSSVGIAVGGTTGAVSTVHYHVTAEQNGTGTDLTDNFAVTAAYDVSGVTYTITNSATLTSWIQKLEAWGLGIYSYDPVSVNIESTASVLEYGPQPLTLNQQYQRDLVYGRLSAEMLLDANKRPHTSLNAVVFYPNRSADLMNAFLTHDVGDLVRVYEQQTGISGYFYIQAVNFSIGVGGNIVCTWILKTALNLIIGLSLVGVEFHAGSTDMIGFGVLPELVLQTTGDHAYERSVEAWVYPHTMPTDEGGSVQIIAGAYSANAGWFLYTTHDVDYGGTMLGWYQETSDPTHPAAWFSSASSLPLNTWTHVVVTRDCTLLATAPKMYFNGVEDTGVTVAGAPAGTIMDEIGAQFAIGNLDTAAHPRTYPFDGIIEEVAPYGRILSATEVADHHLTYNYRLGGELPGVLFHGPAVRTNELAHYTDLTLTDEDKVLDAIFGVVGTRSDGPVTHVLAHDNLLPPPPPP